MTEGPVWRLQPLMHRCRAPLFMLVVLCVACGVDRSGLSSDDAGSAPRRGGAGGGGGGIGGAPGGQDGSQNGGNGGALSWEGSVAHGGWGGGGWGGGGGGTDAGGSADTGAGMDAAVGPCVAGGALGCGLGTYCERPSGNCAGTMGTCTMVPINCNGMAANPVCGCDGVTYNNRCLLRFARASEAHAGNCP